MLKPLLSIIPSKVLSIMGKDYLVYKFISSAYYYKDEKEYRSILLSFKSHKKLSHVRLFSNITDLKTREAAIHLAIQSTLAKYHNYIEENYSGDNYNLADLSDAYSVYEYKGYIKIGYVHNTLPGAKVTRLDKGIGNSKWVTKEDIDTRVKECMEHRRIMNTRYNELLVINHQAYRELVKQQIKERDALLGQSTELKETTMC